MAVNSRNNLIVSEILREIQNRSIKVTTEIFIQGMPRSLVWLGLKIRLTIDRSFYSGLVLD